jgi:hypothetical protein
MTDDRRYQYASGWFLTDEIPEDYFDWEEWMQDEFLEQHLTEEYQHHTANTIWEQIESMESFIKHIAKEGL